MSVVLKVCIIAHEHSLGFYRLPIRVCPQVGFMSLLLFVRFSHANGIRVAKCLEEKKNAIDCHGCFLFCFFGMVQFELFYFLVS